VTEGERRKLPPVAVALAIQLVAGMVCFGIALAINRNADFNLELPLVVAAQGLVAALITYYRGLPGWWLIIQLVLPGAVAAAMLFNLPSWIYLAAFFVIWLFYSNASGEGVPLYLSNQKNLGSPG
jgi:hypothetical protein